MLMKLLGIGGTPIGSGPLPYRLRDDFLSAAEISFYHVLRQVVGERATVCAKVRLADVFFVARPNENAAARNRIRQKHADFLLCDPATMRPLAGIELDDASHGRGDRQGRDAFVEQVFKAAGLPLVRIPVQRAYALWEVEEMLLPVFGKGMRKDPRHAPSAAAGADFVAEVKVAQAAAIPTAPQCPKCGIPLEPRTGPRGNFYGCANFPKCRETAQSG
jgi:hypothetical protein